MIGKFVLFLVKVKNKFYYHIIYKMFLEPYYRTVFKKYGNKVRIGRHCDLYYANIEIGDNVFVGDHASFIASIATIHIGNHVMFGPHVTIRGGTHRIDLVGRYMDSIKESEKLPENDQDVWIDDDVWIGCNVTILKGVHIGRGSVVGAGSVVTKDIPPYSIYVGNHPSLFKQRFSDEEIIKHESLLK